MAHPWRLCAAAGHPGRICRASRRLIVRGDAGGRGDCGEGGVGGGSGEGGGAAMIAKRSSIAKECNSFSARALKSLGKVEASMKSYDASPVCNFNVSRQQLQQLKIFNK